MPKGWDLVGTVYVRGEFYRSIGSTGGELSIFAKFFPTFTIPTRYWFSGKIIGSEVGIAPDAAAWCHTRFGIANMNLSQEDVETNDFDGDEILDRYFDHGIQAFAGDDGSNETDLGLPGDTEISDAISRSRDFYSRTTQLGLPNKAVFSDANQITYVHTFKTSGKLPPTDFFRPKVVAGGFSLDVADANTDWSTAITGNAGGNDDLYRLLLQNLGNAQEAGMSVGLYAPPTTLVDYMGEGYRASAVTDVDMGVFVRVRGTVELKVYDQSGKNAILTMPR